jgi:hypothetical protein
MPVLRVALAFLLAAGLLAVANPADAAYSDRCGRGTLWVAVNFMQAR